MTPATLSNLMDFLGEEVSGDLQVSMIRAFLFVAQRGSCTQKEVEEYLQLSNASASRNVSYWTERRFDRKPGLGMIRRDTDDYDQRQRVLTLTPKGHRFYEEIKKRIK